MKTWLLCSAAFMAAVLLLFYPLCDRADAETVVLKSGQQIKGKIVSQDDTSIKLESGGVVITYFRDEVEKIDSSDAGAVQPGPEQASESQPSGKSPEKQQLGIDVERLFDAGDYAQCVKMLEQHIAQVKNPKEKQVLLLGVCYCLIGEHGKAISTIKDAMQRFPPTSGCYAVLGISYKATGNSEASKEAFRQYAASLKKESPDMTGKIRAALTEKMVE